MPEVKRHNKKPLDSCLIRGDLEKIQQYKGVMVACSGGLDSTVLFRLLWEKFRAKKNFSLAICHTNFGLRGEESDTDAVFVEKMAKKHEVPFFGMDITKKQREERRGQSVQDWARSLRYDFFRKQAECGWLIALAHHENDLAENALLRMARGTSPGGLAGLSVWSGPYWRPLLGVSRKALEEYAGELGLNYREDSSNKKSDYARNRIRHEVLPLLEELYPGAAARISRCAVQAAVQNELCVDHFREQIELLSGPGLQVTWLQKQDRFVRHLIFSRAVGKARQRRKSMSARFLENISDCLEKEPASRKVWEIPAGKGRFILNKGLLRLDKILT